MVSPRLKCAMICGLFLISFVAATAQQQTAQSRTPIVQADWEKGHVIYRVDSKKVGDDILRVLASVYDSVGQDQNRPINVIVDSRLPCEAIWNIEEVAAKVPLDSLRFFIFFKDVNKVCEIEWKPFVPLSNLVPPK